MALFRGKDVDGASLIERLEREGFSGLRNDEVTLLKVQRQVRFVLLEVLEVQDD